MPEDDSSRVSYLGFSGEGKLSTLIAVFENGKVFGIADFSAEAIANLAVNDPTMLTATIRKMKFLKADLTAESPLRRATVYSLPDSQLSIRVVDNSQHCKNVEHQLNIVLIDCEGRLFNGPIGSLSALQSGNLVNFQDDSDPSLSQQTCLDVVILDYGTCAIHNKEGENKSANGAAAQKLALALYSNGCLRILSLSTNCVLRTFRLDLEHSLTTRISVLSPAEDFEFPISGDPQQRPVSMWRAVVVGIETSCESGRITNLLSLLHNTRTRTEFIALQLGACDTLSKDIIPTFPPSDYLFAASVEKNATDVAIGFRINENVRNCVASIIHGLDTNESPKESSPENSVILGVLIGRILRLSAASLHGNDKYSVVRDSEINPFDVEEILDRALELMTSLNSCGEVAVLLNVLIVCVCDPPKGFIDKAVSTAQVSQRSIQVYSIQCYAMQYV